MRSLNLKRAVAVVAGATMVASAFAPAFAAVNKVGGVDSIVASIKASPSDAKVVVGTSGASISDGIAAAKVAALLASMNYVQKDVAAGVPTYTGATTVTVTPQGSTGSVEQASSAYYPAILTADDVSGAYSATLDSSLTLTPQTLSGVLSTGKVDATVDGSSKTYSFEERIMLDGDVQALYSEDDDANTHGLYLSTDGTNGLEYQLFFTSPMPADASFDETPTIKILGSEYSIDTKDLADGSLSLFSGQKSVLKVGDVQTVGAYTVKITSVGQTSSSSGTQIAVSVTVTDGTNTNTKTINAGSGYDFFGGKVSVYIDSALVNTGDANSAVVRIGSGKVTLDEGSPFPLDNAWTVETVDLDASDFGGFTLKYGNPDLSDKVLAGAFDGTYENGLAQGISIMGPKNVEGSSTFAVALKGFGGTKTYYPTELVLKGVQDGSDSAIQATWTDMDGVTNTFAPTKASQVEFGTTNTSVDFNLVKSTTPYTIIGDKVLYFEKTETQGTGSEKQYRAVFQIGGSNGQEIASEWTTAGDAIDAVDPLEVSFTSLDTSKDYTFNVQLESTTEVRIDASTADFYPNAIAMGSTLMDTNPTMNLVSSLGEDGDVVIAQAGSAHSLDAAWMTSGDNDGFTVQEGAETVIDQTGSTIETSDKYAITGGSTVIDGSTTKKLDMMLADDVMDSVVSISGVTGNSTQVVSAGDKVLSAGDTLAGVVKVVAITCPVATSTVSGKYYTQAKEIDPTAIVVKDADASGTYQIVIGGPAVNSVAKQMTSALVKEGDQVIEAGSSKLYVAGYTATDTEMAVSELISLLKA